MEWLNDNTGCLNGGILFGYGHEVKVCIEQSICCIKYRICGRQSIHLPKTEVVKNHYDEHNTKSRVLSCLLYSIHTLHIEVEIYKASKRRRIKQNKVSPILLEIDISYA